MAIPARFPPQIVFLFAPNEHRAGLEREVRHVTEFILARHCTGPNESTWPITIILGALIRYTFLSSIFARNHAPSRLLCHIKQLQRNTATLYVKHNCNFSSNRVAATFGAGLTSAPTLVSETVYLQSSPSGAQYESSETWFHISSPA